MKCDGHAIVAHPDVLGQGLVLGREHDTIMFQSGPLLGAIALGSVLPPAIFFLSIFEIFLVLRTFLLRSFLALLGGSSRRGTLRFRGCTLGGCFLERLVVVGILLLDTVGLLLGGSLGLLEWHIVAVFGFFGLHSLLRADGLGCCLCLLLNGDLFLGEFLGERYIGVILFADLFCGDLGRFAPSLLSKRLVVFGVRSCLVLGRPSAFGLCAKLDLGRS